MPHAVTKDNVRLHYEEAGSGTPIIFLHEFAADHTNWEPQMRYFSRGHRCIAYSARGYTPSDVPPTPESYTYKHFYTDALAVLDHLTIDRAHFVGLSMGSYSSLQVGLNAPERALSRHDSKGSANTMRGFQGGRPSIYTLTDAIRKVPTPALIICGDEDDACVEPSLFLKKHLPAAGLTLFPKSGHVLNLEEPALFNEMVERFIALVEAGRWPVRDPRSMGG